MRIRIPINGEIGGVFCGLERGWINKDAIIIEELWLPIAASN
jgi:hypothetical protein